MENSDFRIQSSLPDQAQNTTIQNRIAKANQGIQWISGWPLSSLNKRKTTLIQNLIEDRVSIVGIVVSLVSPSSAKYN